MTVVERRNYLDELNSAQRAAVEYGIGDAEARPASPLLIIAGAGTGKTNTLAHRVAHLLLHGADPERVLLLTFTRRAAQEMTRRAQHICAAACSPARAQQIRWSGTFHSIAQSVAAPLRRRRWASPPRSRCSIAPTPRI